MSPFALGFAGVATWITMLGLFVILFPVEGYAIPSYLEVVESFSSVWLGWLHLRQSATSRYRLR